MRKRHKQERDALAAKLDQEGQKNEKVIRQQTDAEMEQLLHEKKNRDAAEVASRKDLTQEQTAEVRTCVFS